MKSKLLMIVLIIAGALLGAQAVTDGAALLKASDESFIPQRASFQMKLETYENNKLKNWMLMDCFVDGADRYLLVFKDPGTMRGITQLRLSGTIYQYVRKVDKLSQASAKESFQQSTLSQEDIMSATLSRFYTVEKVEQVTGADGRAKYSLSLVAQSKDVAYMRIVNLIDAATLLPERRMYYGSSGKLIKEMIIEEIQKAGNEVKLIRFRMVDALRPQSYTLVTMDNFDTKANLPATMFTQQYMRAAAR